MNGPYDDGYLTMDSINIICETPWKVSHNAARGGIRRIGPKPRWARDHGGEGGSIHPKIHKLYATTSLETLQL